MNKNSLLKSSLLLLLIINFESSSVHSAGPPPPPPPPPAAASQPRPAGLLGQIEKGFQLKKVTEEDKHDTFAPAKVKPNASSGGGGSSSSPGGAVSQGTQGPQVGGTIAEQAAARRAQMGDFIDPRDQRKVDTGSKQVDFRNLLKKTGTASQGLAAQPHTTSAQPNQPQKSRPAVVLAGSAQGNKNYSDLEESYKNHNFDKFKRKFNKGTAEAQARLFILTKRELVKTNQNDTRKNWVSKVVNVSVVSDEIKRIVNANDFKNPNYKFNNTTQSNEFLRLNFPPKMPARPLAQGAPVGRAAASSKSPADNQVRYEESLDQGFTLLASGEKCPWINGTNIGSSQELIDEMNRIGAAWFGPVSGGSSSVSSSSPMPQPTPQLPQPIPQPSPQPSPAQGSNFVSLDEIFDIDFGPLDAFLAQS